MRLATISVAGGVERDGAVGGELVGVAEGEDMLGALLRRKTGAHEAGRGAGAEDLGVARHMVGVGVGNEAALSAAGRVEGPADLGQVDAVVCFDFPSHEGSHAKGVAGSEEGERATNRIRRNADG